jgi:hypothetical protein
MNTHAWHTLAHHHCYCHACRGLLIAEKDALVGEAEEKGLEYVRTAGEYGHMVKDVIKAMSFYVSAMFRVDPRLAIKVGISETAVCVVLACLHRCMSYSHVFQSCADARIMVALQ